MSEYMGESGIVGRFYCPTCEQDADPIAEVLHARPCDRHQPDLSGIDDGTTQYRSYLSGSTDADGWTCKAFADLLRGKPSD